MTKKYYSYEETHHKFGRVKQKRCRRCRKWQDESEFRKDRARKDGLRLYCKGCDTAYERKRRRKSGRAVRQYLRYEERHRTVRGVKEKLCCRCKQWKYESHFSRNCRTKDGLSFRCKECERKHARQRFEQQRVGARRNLRYEDRHRVVNGVKEKFCRKCSKWKTESEFYRNRSARDGLNDRCKKCSYKAVGKSRKKVPGRA